MKTKSHLIHRILTWLNSRDAIEGAGDLDTARWADLPFYHPVQPDMPQARPAIPVQSAFIVGSR